VLRQRIHSSDSNRHSYPPIYGRGRPELKGLGRARIVDREVDDARTYSGVSISARIVEVGYLGRIVCPDRIYAEAGSMIIGVSATKKYPVLFLARFPRIATRRYARTL
jgi:hypothetical protein